MKIFSYLIVALLGVATALSAELSGATALSAARAERAQSCIGKNGKCYGSSFCQKQCRGRK